MAMTLVKKTEEYTIYKRSDDRFAVQDGNRNAVNGDEKVRILAAEGMTMFIVSHEMGFVREVSSRVAFMADGRIVEIGGPHDLFDRPQEARTKDFVSKILRH